MDDQRFQKVGRVSWLFLLPPQNEPEQASNQMEISKVLDFVVAAAAAAAAAEVGEFVVDNNAVEGERLQNLDHTEGYRAASVLQTEAAAAVVVDDDVVVGGRTAAVAASCTAASFLGPSCR